MGKKKGDPKTGGRRRGTPNKVTAGVREALAKVFEMTGDVDGLAEWARENRGEFYKLWARMLPQEVRHDTTEGGPVRLLIEEIIVESPSRTNQ